MATSPPAYHNTIPTNPKKRASISSAASATGSASKRPRLSHPLRQTSFPAHDAGAFYASAGPLSARSETGSVAASAVSGTSVTKPRGRGRPRKHPRPEDSITGDGASQVDGSRSRAGAGAGAGAGARSVVSAHNNDDAAGDEDEDDAADIARFSSSHTESEKQLDAAETQRRDRLKEALSDDQMGRLEKWRAVSFPKRTIQKLVNQIVSQSVTESPINAVRVYGKWFVAEIVERARQIQVEWAEAYDKTRNEDKLDREKKLENLQEKLKNEDAKPDSQRISEYDRRRLLAQIDRAKTDAEEYIPNPHRGGLLPDHLREALRRYRSDGEGGGVGFEGLSHPLLGAHGSRIWAQGNGTTGRRMFQ